MDISIIFGIAAIMCAAAAFQASSLRAMFFLNSMAASLIGTYFLMIGAVSGGIMAYGSSATILAQGLFGEAIGMRGRILISLPVLLLAIVLRESGAASILPVIAFLVCRLGEVAYHPLWTRIFLGLGYTLWILYGVYHGAFWAVAYEAVAIISILISLIRKIPEVDAVHPRD